MLTDSSIPLVCGGNIYSTLRYAHRSGLDDGADSAVRGHDALDSDEVEARYRRWTVRPPQERYVFPSGQRGGPRPVVAG